MNVVVTLPTQLRRLAGLSGSTVKVETPGGRVTLSELLDALERDHPALRGTIRDHPGRDGSSGPLRPFIRFFALESDLTQAGLSAPLPAEVTEGREVLRIIGAIAGG